MKRLPGQALPWLRQAAQWPARAVARAWASAPPRGARRSGLTLTCLHGATRLLLALLVAVTVAGGWLAWRLNEGPLPVPLLARQLERAVNAESGGSRLQIREAAIAWEGFRTGTAAPLDIQLRGVRVVDPGGGVRAELPDAAATLSMAALLRGRVVPATIELRRPSVLVLRGADGRVGLDVGSLGSGPGDGASAALPRAPVPGEVAPGTAVPGKVTPGEAVPGAPPPAGAPAAEGTTPGAAPAAAASAEATPMALQVLAALMQPASEHGSYTALRRIRLVGGEITVVDRALGQTWALLDPNLDIRREAGGGLVLDGAATLRLGDLTMQVRLSGQALGSPMRVTAGITLPALSPRDLARAVPALAPLAVLDTRVSLGAFMDFDAAGQPQGVRARVTAAAGALDLGQGRRLAFAGLEATASGNSQAVELREARLRLPGEAGRPGPELLVSGSSRLADGMWQTALEAQLAPMAVTELGRVWPAWVADGLRRDVLPRLVDGRLREAKLRLALRLPASLDAPESLHALDWQQAEARLALDRPVLELTPGDRRPAEAMELVARATPTLLQVEKLEIRLPEVPHPGAAPGPASTITLDGEATREGLGWRLVANAGLDVVDLADAAVRWPLGIGNEPRQWLTRNLTAGIARNGRWTVEARLPPGLGELDVTALTGRMEVADAAVHWLRPVPPMAGASGTVEFGLKEITVRAQGARQVNADGSRGNLVARDVTIRFFALDTRPGQVELVGQFGGPLAEVVTLLRHPRLKLFEKRPLELAVRGGQVEARLTLALPMWDELPIEELRLRVAGRVTDGRLADVVLGRDVDQGMLDLVVDTESLKLNGEARLGGVPARLALDMDFRSGPATQLLERATVTGRIDAAQLADWGLDPGQVLTGPLGLEVRFERRRNGQGTVTLAADLRQAVMALAPIGWTKLAGTAGSAEAVLRLAGNNLVAVDSFKVEALELALRGRMGFGRGARLERVELVDTLFGGSRLSGDIRPPAAAGGPWQVALRGPLLDLRPMFGPTGHVAGGGAPPGRAEPAPAPPEADGPPLALDLRFDRVTMGEGRNLANLQARARTDARGLLREARITGLTGPSAGFEGTLTPRNAAGGGQQRVLRLQAADGGALLRALDLVQPVQGGRLLVNAVYDELRPGAALVGTAELDGFVVRDAPAIGKILQAMTLFGLGDALSGPGLSFARLVAPFRLTPDALELTDARAFSASLGVTAKGRVLRERPGQSTVLELEGTIVPAYVFNTLLGNIPVLGRIFSPEAGGGVFAATWRVQGPVSAPEVSINPLAALTPGFLRGLFGIVETPMGRR